MDLEVKGVAASSRKPAPLSTKETKLAQGWGPHTQPNRGSRPPDVPCLDLGKLEDSEDEDADRHMPYSMKNLQLDPPPSSSTVSWGTPLRSSYARHHVIQQTSRRPHPKSEFPLAEQNTISENLPPPTAAYKLKYQQYEAEMKEGYKQHSQRAAEKKANYNQSSESPRKTPEKQDAWLKNQTDDELTALDEKALLQQCYTSKPYTAQHSIRKLEAEDVAAERRKQTVVEQVMIDQLSRAVISDPEQNGHTYETDSVLPGIRTAPLRFRKRTLHETKIRTRSALTENMLTNKLRFDGRLISRNGRDACRELTGFFFVYDKSLTVYEFRQFGKNRSNALPFVPKGVYNHQRGPRKGKPYSLNDFYVGADLTFLSLHHPSLPESIKQKLIFTIRITDIDEAASTVLKSINAEKVEPPINQETGDINIFKKVQDGLKEKLSKRGVRTVTGLGKYFRELDKNQKGVFTKADFKQALKVFHLEVPEEDFESLWLLLCDNDNDEVDYLEFTHAILGEMNEYRKAFVRKAYMKLDYNKTGSVPLVNIKKCYCARIHPQVLNGNATEEEIKSSFLETLQDACSDPNEVSFSEFEDYYEGLSIGIMDDEDFVNTLRNPWGI